MKTRLNNRHRALTVFSIIAASLVAITLAGTTLAADMPKRKPGLWEIKVHMDGMPDMGPMQQCIDQNTDNLMQQEAQQGKPDCSVMDVKTAGNTVTIHAVCKIQGTTATTDGVFQGTFDSSYTGTMKTKFNPPMQGMSESNLTQKARWLGPCKPGQKAGDMIMPGIGGMNLQDMMNDPKIQEMMQQQSR